METPKAILGLSYQAVLIGLMTFIFPIWITTGINWGAVMVKIYTWYSQSTNFWEYKPHAALIIMIAFIPLVYLVWFYYLTIQRIIRKVYETELIHWNRPIAEQIGTSLIDWKENGGKNTMENTEKIITDLLQWFNQKMNAWPKIISWATRKLLQQLPLLDILLELNSPKYLDQIKPQMINKIESKINDIMIGLIDSFVPDWTKFIIPANLLLLFFLWKA